MTEARLYDLEKWNNGTISERYTVLTTPKKATWYALQGYHVFKILHYTFFLLGFERQYELYDIVLKKQKWSNSSTRDLELVAVAKAIEGTRGIDTHRLTKIKTGFKSEMAATARPKDGFTKPAKKKV